MKKFALVFTLALAAAALAMWPTTLPNGSLPPPMAATPMPSPTQYVPMQPTVVRTWTYKLAQNAPLDPLLTPKASAPETSLSHAAMHNQQDPRWRLLFDPGVQRTGITNSKHTEMANPMWVPAYSPREAPSQTPSSRADVPLTSNRGTFVVPVEINGVITRDFTVDSGATDVAIPLDVFSTLKRTGTIKDADILGQKTYMLADGSKLQSFTFRIRSLKVGDRVLENVTANVEPSGGMLLLGQSFLSRFKSWSIDNTTHELLLVPR